MKGSSVIHQADWVIGNETISFFGYDADFQEELTANYVEYYNLDAETFAWTNDGATAVEDFADLYNNLLASNYGPQSIKLAPLVKYEAATEATIRGIRVDADEEKGTYDVDFVVALGEIENVAAVGFDIVKTVSYYNYAKVTTANVETTEVYTTINANGIKLDAAAGLGAGEYSETTGEGEDAVTTVWGYAAAFGLDDEAVIEGAYVYYDVTVYTIALDGTKTVSNETVSFYLYEGQY